MTPPRRTRWWLALAVSCAWPAWGADYSQHLLGDWDGVRSNLVAHGTELDLTYVNEFAANVHGGDNSQAADADQIYLGGRFDLEQLVDVPGAKLVFSFTDRNGQSLSVDAGLNTLLEVQEIYGKGSYTRLNQLYWEQDLFGEALQLKLGRMTGSFDFMPFSCNFQNITFCANLMSHNVVPNWIAFPASTWAGVARLKLHRDWYVQTGVYEVNPALARDTVALGRPFGGSGTREVFEAGWLPLSAGPRGGYRLGAWYDDVGGNDVFVNRAGQPLATRGGEPQQQHSQSGFYAMAQQRVWPADRSAARGISVFANFVQADRRISATQQIAEAGLFWSGPWAARPRDEIGLAVGRVQVNRRIAEGESLYDADVALPMGLPPEPVLHAEYPSEIYYSFNFARGITVRPNLQYIHSPGGDGQSQDVLVLGTHLSFDF
ncbi:MAG: carbohydrate porin [Nevskia sp.]|nr:carbohydrate porin [Nevskia sp.]